MPQEAAQPRSLSDAITPSPGMNRLLSLGFLFVAAIVLISIATKYSRGVAFRSQNLSERHFPPPRTAEELSAFVVKDANDQRLG